MRRTLLFASLWFAATAAGATEPPPQLVAEVDAALLRLADAGQLPSMEAGPVRVEQPPRVRHELGAVLDLSDARPGAPVLAITPGGAAEGLGLRRGDRVLELNGVELAGATDVQTLRRALEAGEGGLVLAVERDGGRMQLRGLADSTALPGYQLLLAGVDSAASSCGRISVFDVYPRSRKVYPVSVIAIDGRYPGPGPSFRLEPGRHLVTVAERIDLYEFTPIELRRRGTGRGTRADGAPQAGGERGDAGGLGAPESVYQEHNRRRNSRYGYKDLEVVVQPGVTHRIAAQFLESNVVSVQRNTYWEPIVWKDSQEPCR
jgi:membrane-associated protease RseP (regulator of RpoE activity)